MTLKKELTGILAVLESTIADSVKVMPKFEVGSPQHTLLTNRIKALEIAKNLMLDDPNGPFYSKEELQAAKAPIQSLLNKSEKAMTKFKTGHPAYIRLNKIIQAMTFSEMAIEEAIDNRVTRVFRHH